VRVHRPIHAGGAEWGAGWSDGRKNADGSFTVSLYDGRNVVEVSSSSSGFKEYHVINARGIGINVRNATNQGWTSGRPLNPGDELEISFDGIRTPLEKISGIYNPGFPDTCYVSYRTADGQEARGEGVQYDLSKKNTVKVTVPESGELKLTGGVINCDHMGDPLGSHRTRPGNEPVYPNFAAVNVLGVYSAMPEIDLSGGGINNPGASDGGGGGCNAGALGLVGLAAFVAGSLVITSGKKRRRD
jgi:hypothetical protein